MKRYYRWLERVLCGIFMGLCVSQCTGHQEAVSFDQLFPDSPFKQMLVLYMKVWSELRYIQNPDLLCRDEFVFRKSIASLNKMNEHIKKLTLLSLDEFVIRPEQRAYVLALLSRMYKEHSLWLGNIARVIQEL